MNTRSYQLDGFSKCYAGTTSSGSISTKMKFLKNYINHGKDFHPMRQQLQESYYQEFSSLFNTREKETILGSSLAPHTFEKSIKAVAT